MEDNLPTETTILQDRTKLTVTRQVDFDVKDKVDRQAFQEAARLIGLPKVVTDLEFVFITLICQATDEGKNEIWENEGGAYVSLTLPYQLVISSSSTEVTEHFLETYRKLTTQVVQIPHISALE